MDLDLPLTPGVIFSKFCKEGGTNEGARVKRGKRLPEAGCVMEKDLFFSLEKLINNVRVSQQIPNSLATFHPQMVCDHNHPLVK